ncbi:hypothetical protein PGB90_001852 [Kerria lacca]
MALWSLITTIYSICSFHLNSPTKSPLLSYVSPDITSGNYGVRFGQTCTSNQRSEPPCSPDRSHHLSGDSTAMAKL